MSSTPATEAEPSTADDDEARFVALRRELHAHPELGFEEHWTSERVAGLLAEWGIEVHRGLATTGVVGTLRNGTGRHGRGRNGTGRRALALRADMDALPITEANTFAHASRTPGTMHACGHDGHTTMLLAAAHRLAREREFDGTVHFVFQPAEEGGGGALRMIEDGLFDRFPVDAVFGFHNWPGRPLGEVAVASGPVMASSNRFYLTIEGRGGHAAQPHTTVDPIPIACQVVQAFQSIAARMVDPGEPVVISVSTIHAGDTNNVIPDRCELSGTVRTFATDVLDLVEERMRAVAENFSAAAGARADFRFVRQYPPTVNTEPEVEFVRQAAGALVGPDRVVDHRPVMPSEDFSFLLQRRPGAFIFLGNGDSAGLHSPTYDFADELVPLGAALWVELVRRWLAPTPDDSANPDDSATPDDSPPPATPGSSLS